MKLETIEQSHYYHIYNREINGTDFFITEEILQGGLRQHLAGTEQVKFTCMV